MSPPNSSKSLPRKRDVLKFLSIVTALLIPLTWALELLVAENGSLAALLLYLPQHFYMALPLLLGVWALCARRFGVVGIHMGLLAFCLLGPMGWRWHLRQRPQSGTVRVVTFNVQRGEGDVARVDATLRALRPDIVCLQETGRSSAPLENGVGHYIAGTFPGWNARYAGDVTTLSRFPVVSERVYPLPGTRRTLETVLLTPKGLLRVLNTHVSTSFAGNRAPTSQLDRVAVLFETARPSAQARLRQLPALREAIESGDAKMPLLLLGDFNTPPRGHFYEGIARDMDDAFARVGDGLGLSFPSRFPLLRIDFVWTRGVRATRVFVENASGSDHRPLVADVEVGG